MSVHVQVDAFQLRQPDEVGSDQDSEIFTLNFPSLSLSGVSLVLKSYPELVHLDKVGQNEAYRVLKITTRSEEVSEYFDLGDSPIANSYGKEVSRLSGQVMTQEQASSRMLHSS